MLDPTHRHIVSDELEVLRVVLEKLLPEIHGVEHVYDVQVSQGSQVGELR